MTNGTAPVGCARCGFMTCGWNSANECEGMVNPALVADRDYRANRSWVGRVWDNMPGVTVNLGLGRGRPYPSRGQWQRRGGWQGRRGR